MEHERSSGGSFVAEESLSVRARLSQPMAIAAILAVLALIAVILWNVGHAMGARQSSLSVTVLSRASATTTSSLGAATSSQALGPAVLGSILQSYQTLRSQDAYTTEAGHAVGQSLAEQLQAPISYRTFEGSDLRTTDDTSYARMLEYRTDLQGSLAPLLKNKEPEFELFGHYIETNDQTSLEALREAARNYFAAASSSSEVVVPKDAVGEQVAVLNALEEFGAVLNAMADDVQDPIASAILLRNYNRAEADVYTAFGYLASYFAHHRRP